MSCRSASGIEQEKVSSEKREESSHPLSQQSELTFLFRNINTHNKSQTFLLSRVRICLFECYRFKENNDRFPGYPPLDLPLPLFWQMSFRWR